VDRLYLKLLYCNVSYENIVLRKFMYILLDLLLCMIWTHWRVKLSTMLHRYMENVWSAGRQCAFARLLAMLQCLTYVATVTTDSWVIVSLSRSLMSVLLGEAAAASRCSDDDDTPAAAVVRWHRSLQAKATSCVLGSVLCCFLFAFFAHKHLFSVIH